MDSEILRPMMMPIFLLFYHCPIFSLSQRTIQYTLIPEIISFLLKILFISKVKTEKSKVLVAHTHLQELSGLLH